MNEAPIALVTGANRGIGRETARQLGQLGMTVLLGSRDRGRGAAAAAELAADGLVVTAVVLDVTEPRSVEALADGVLGSTGRLDVLVNNAGTFVGATAERTTAVEMARTFDVNVFGPVTTIHVLLPYLRRSPGPRIVNVSSTTASLALTADGAELPGDADCRLAYASSKAALNMLTVQYARAFSHDPTLAHIKVNAATPGYTATDMNGHRGTRRVEDAARVIVELATLPDDGPTGGFFDYAGVVPW